ncbi:MAG: response regulator [Oligoflexales bacterium]
MNTEKRKIIIAGDDEKLLETLYSTFESDFEVFLAKDEKEAYEIFFQIRPSLIITSFKMNIMDGINLTKKIKMLSPSTIVYSICSEKETIEQSAEGGPDKIFAENDSSLFNEVCKSLDNYSAINSSQFPLKIEIQLEA